jgi:AcrR family transcriptional regulator
MAERHQDRGRGNGQDDAGGSAVRPFECSVLRHEREDTSAVPNFNGHSGGFVRSEALEAIQAAFNALVLERGYDALAVRDIIARAAVGRSTFYEYFSGKRELLREAMTPLLAVLATTASAPDMPGLVWVLDHFAKQRALALALFKSEARDLIAETLATLIVAQMSDANPAVALRLDRSLPAAQVALGHIGLIGAWLEKPEREPAGVIAEALARTTAASLAALRA